MHQTLEIYMARKKRVPGCYNPDSYRVFDEQVGDASLGDDNYNKVYLDRKKDPPPPHPRDPERRNCPQPYFSRFLTNNARTLNEPICIIQDEKDASLPKHWWPGEVAVAPLTKVPDVTKNTTQRTDYIKHDPKERKVERAKNYFFASSKGIVPVNPPKRKDDPGEVLLEKISFFHDFDSRKTRMVPRRGRLRGYFVWDRVVKDAGGNDVVETAWNRGEIENQKSMQIRKRSSKEREEYKPSAPPGGDKIPPIDGVPPP